MEQIYLVTVHIGELTGKEIEDKLKAFPKSRIHSVEKYQVTYYTKLNNENVILSELEDVTSISTSGTDMMKLSDYHFVVCLKPNGDINFNKKDHQLAGHLFNN